MGEMLPNSQVLKPEERQSQELRPQLEEQPDAGDGFDVPILFIVFNRPDLTATVFDRIRAIRPHWLFIAADGPREGTPEDYPKVEQVRRIVEEIDWTCTVQRLYHESNRGCLRAVTEGLTWFFKCVEQGIIIEDDCLPDFAFFPYCRSLLRRYAACDNVLHIGGTNPLPPYLRPTSYYFSKYNRIWGWATWRRAWQHFDATLSFWPVVKVQGKHLQFFPDVTERHLWENHWDAIYAGARDTWDHQWFLCRLLQGLAIVPMANLVSNLGFRADAVHTTNPDSNLAHRPCYPLPQPLIHPDDLHIDEELDRRFFDEFVRARAAAALAREIKHCQE